MSLFLVALALWRWGTVVARNALTLAAADETLPTWPIIASLCAIRGAALCYAAGASCVFAGMALATGGTTGEEGGTVAYAKLGVPNPVLFDYFRDLVHRFSSALDLVRLENRQGVFFYKPGQYYSEQSH